MTTPPRIGITGFAHETNALAAAVTLGDGLQIAATPGGLAATWEAGPLLARLNSVPAGRSTGTPFAPSSPR